MTSFTQTFLVAGTALLLGTFVLYRSVRRGEWKRRVLAWVGVVNGVAVLGIGGLLGVALHVERHTMMGPDRPTPQELARPVDAFEYRLLSDNGEGRLDSHQGEVILVNPWATWCIPCIEKMPYLDRLQAEYAEDGTDYRCPDHEVRQTAVTKAHTLPENTVNAYAPDQGALPQPFRRGFRKLPTSYVIGRDSFIREFWVGSRDGEGLESKVLPHL